MYFEDLGLDSSITKAVSEAGYDTPTKIQKQAIPAILKGFDIRASAQTGTGKTAAFLLPALHCLAQPNGEKGKGPKVLILVPTRELAMQIAQQAQKYSKYLPRVKTVCVVGGVPYPQQRRQLSRPYDILIATPGRLIDFMQQKQIHFPSLQLLVLDEADRMLDMGFTEPVEQIVAATPSSRQTLLFSATLGKSIIELSNRLMNKPVEIAVQAQKAKHDNIQQKLHYVDDLHHKNRLLNHILSDREMENAIIFTSTKRHADKLAQELKEQGLKAGALHGDMRQGQRTRMIAQLRRGKINILVATDVAARGIDVQSITHVVNFDLPNNPEDYVHRIGRTGRAGATGTALSFVAGRDASIIQAIQKFTGNKISVAEIAGLEPRAKPQFRRQRERSPFGARRNSQNRAPYRFQKGKKSKSSQKPNFKGRKRGLEKAVGI